MASEPSTSTPSAADPAAALRDALASWIGARVDGVHVNPETGLIALSCYAGEKRLLGLGIGPRVVGVGILPRAPRLRATAAHPLVAALRAHLVGHRLQAITLDQDQLALVAGGGEGEEAHEARLTVTPGRRGEARLDVDGRLVLRWPPQAAQATQAAGSAASTQAAGSAASAQATGSAPPLHAGLPGVRYPADPHAAGAALVETSDAAAAAAVRTALLKAVRARHAALNRRRDAVRADLARLDRVAELQKIGSLLLAQGNRVPRGATRASLDDWETGGKLDITLDPSRPARAQAEDYFATARRYQRGEAVMRTRLAETERSLEAIAALEAEIEAVTTDTEALSSLGQRARALGVTGVGAEAEGGRAGAGGGAGRAGKGRHAEEARRPYQAFRGANDRAILVGRGGEDNDALTTRHARPHDLWLHARGTPGAHVVVPLDKNTSCPGELLADAAMLAVHFSDARGEASWEVTYVPRRHVRKPKGSAPGAVTFTREKVMVVRMDAARVTRLLATKEGAS